ncbi:MAG: DUF4234 domain-containing protein [Ruminococcus sp.]|nr:DUF4234 domain-containing protein [Ruminococcus sp.]
MKICPSCGRELNDAAMFCGSCGQNLSAVSAAPAPAPEMPAAVPAPEMPAAAAPAQPGEMPMMQTVYAYSDPAPTPAPMPAYDPNMAAQPAYDPNMAAQPAYAPNMAAGYGYAQPGAPVYVQPVYAQPVAQLSTSRGVLKCFLLSLITFGIYTLIFWSGISTDINTIAQRYDGKKTMHFCLLFFIVGPLTLGIGYLVWMHNLCSRIGNELGRRGQTYSFGAGDFWIFGFLLSFTIVCPIIFFHKLCTAMNVLSANYNQIG